MQRLGWSFLFCVDGTAKELELEEELEGLEEVFEEALEDEFVEDTGSTHTLVSSSNAQAI